MLPMNDSKKLKKVTTVFYDKATFSKVRGLRLINEDTTQRSRSYKKTGVPVYKKHPV